MGKRYVFYDIKSCRGLNHPDPNLPSRTRRYFTRVYLLGEQGEKLLAIWKPPYTQDHLGSHFKHCCSATRGWYHLCLLSRPVTTSFSKDPPNNYLNIDPDIGLIRMVNRSGPTNAWKEAPSIAMAVKGSSFAIIRKPEANKLVSRIYYQDPELRLRECCYDHLGTADEWTIGEQSSRFMSIH